MNFDDETDKDSWLRATVLRAELFGPWGFLGCFLGVTIYYRVFLLGFGLAIKKKNMFWPCYWPFRKSSSTAANPRIAVPKKPRSTSVWTPGLAATHPHKIDSKPDSTDVEMCFHQKSLMCSTPFATVVWILVNLFFATCNAFQEENTCFLNILLYTNMSLSMLNLI